MYTLEVIMSWLIRTFGASIGKKLLMAITGLGFLGFLCAHLAGNLTLYKGVLHLINTLKSSTRWVRF